MNTSTPRIANHRAPVRAHPGLGRPARRGPLDALAGLALWLTLLHGMTGTGIGFAIGSLLL